MGCTIGHAKCSKCSGFCSTTDGSNSVGVNARLHVSQLLAVSKLSACFVTIRCCAPLGIGTYGARATGDAKMPRVLLCVTLRWTHGVPFNFRFAVRLRASMMPRASVILGIVMIGESSITLCSAACIILSFTLCSSAVDGGASNVVIGSWRRRRICCPLGRVLAWLVSAVSSSVSALKC
jgi:hypothetical protein